MKVRIKRPSSRLTFDERLTECDLYDDLDSAVTILNKRHFTIRVGNKNVVGDYRPRDEAERGVVLFTTDEFNKRYKSYHFTNPITERSTKKELGPLWLASQQHRHYDGTLVFKPAGVRSPARASDYNQWKGCAVSPTQGKWDRLRAHLHDNVCTGHGDWCTYLLKFLACMVQYPGRLPGVAIVLRGEEGVGKTCVYDYVKRVFRPTDTVLVSGSNDLTASFNAHLAAKVWVCADEAFFAGDPRVFGQLQSMITSEELLLHPKGIDRYKIDNCMHLLIVSNHDWVVRASKEARRYFVLEVGKDHQRDFTYFNAITRQMDHEGGTAAMLYDLLHMDLSDFNPMEFPNTPFLQEQKEHSRSPHEQWHQEELAEAHSGAWVAYMQDKKRVHVRYTEWMKLHQLGRPLTIERLSKYFVGLYGRSVVGRLRQSGLQKKVYLFPSLSRSRSRFDPVRWPPKQEEDDE